MNFKIFLLSIVTAGLLFSCKSKQIIYKKPTPRATTPSKVTKVERVEKEEFEEKVVEEKKVEKVTVVKQTHKKSAPAMGTYTSKVENYIHDFSEVAKNQMKQYKIPASITLAQGILESGAGTGDLTQRANNHFGIKCHDWKGAVVYHDDDKSQECFRKYSNAAFSYQDHSLFLTTRSRYLDLFKLPIDDYKGWAKGLQKAGYATDPKYPSKLIRIIETYKLYYFDAEVLGKTKKQAKKTTTQSDQYVVAAGDTLYSIARKNKLSVDELKQINGLEDNTIFEGQTLYIKPLESEF